MPGIISYESQGGLFNRPADHTTTEKKVINDTGVVFESQDGYADNLHLNLNKTY